MGERRASNRTNVRVSSNGVGLIRFGFAVLNHVPPLAAAAAERLFFTPPRAKRKAAVGAQLQRLRAAGGLDLAAWSWGEGPAVLLLHGWGGSSAQLAGLAPSLVARGFRVVALDAPGHGLSGGRMSSMPEFARAAFEAARRLGPFHAVVGHSLGGAALALALRDGLEARRAVFIGTPGNPVEWTRRFAHTLGVGARTLAGMKARSERRLGFRWEELDVVSFAPRMTVPLLAIHDADDREVPLAEGEAIAKAWPGASLVATRGLGHSRILRDAEVASRVAAFVAGASFVEGSASAPGCLAEGCEKPVRVAGALCAPCELERELFEPELRRRRWAPEAA